VDRGQHLGSYGAFVSTLAPWTHFITLTHDPRRLADHSSSWSRVGIQGHRSRLRRFVLDTVRRLDPSSVWWSEMELHESGQPHEHALAAFGPTAPVLSIRQRWFDMAGYATFDPIRDAADVAAYVGKYGAKRAAYPPFVAGLALNPRESFSMVLR
jgi:hypothetical protein